jgi:hypothetical protein
VHGWRASSPSVRLSSVFSRARRRTSGGSSAKLAETAAAPFSRRIPRPLPATAQDVLAVLVEDLVLAVAEEREVVVGEPLRGRRAPLVLVLVHRAEASRRASAIVSRTRCASLPVLDGRAHVAEHAMQVGWRSGAPVRRSAGRARRGSATRLALVAHVSEPSLVVARDAHDRPESRGESPARAG